jgi:hypothetical protein
VKQLKNKNMKTLNTLKLTLVNAETVINSNAREYNPSEWTRTVERYQKFNDVMYYKVENETRYGRDEFVVEFTNNSGYRTVQLLSYSLCLHNGGFYNILKTMCDANFTSVVEYIMENKTLENYKFDPTKFIMVICEFNTADGKTGPAENCDANRKLFIENKQTVTRETFGLILK